MSKTNCVNCGAAKDTSEIKCPFCGTTYLDLTAIDFSSDDPVVCQFVLPQRFHGGKRMVMSMLAIPHLDTITQTANTVDVMGYGGLRLTTMVTGYDIDIGVSFTPIERTKGKEICTLKVLEE